ncbi:MAG: hypothetical protein R3245_06420, partial [Kiloniellales bacterium]|nr:hypothetical protein [Kiloniellales bacterium]
MRQRAGRGRAPGPAAHGPALLVLLALLFAPWPAFAQAAGQTAGAPALSENASEQIESIVRAVALIDRLSNSEDVDDQTLAAARVKLDGLERDLDALRGTVEARIADINGRIDQIAPAAGSSAPEPPSVAEERIRLTDERAFLAALVGRIENSKNTVTAIVEQIAEKRRAAFADALFRRTRIDRSLLQDTWQASRGETASLYVLISNWLTFVVRTKPVQFILSTLGALVLAL